MLAVLQVEHRFVVELHLAQDGVLALRRLVDEIHVQVVRFRHDGAGGGGTRDGVSSICFFFWLSVFVFVMLAISFSFFLLDFCGGDSVLEKTLRERASTFSTNGS